MKMELLQKNYDIYQKSKERSLCATLIRMSTMIQCRLVSHRELFLHPYYFSALLMIYQMGSKLYADDVLLYMTIYSQDDCYNLQQDLNLL